MEKDQWSVNSDSEFSDNSDCYSDMFPEALTSSEQTTALVTKMYMAWSMGRWTKVEAEGSRFSFSDKPGLNIDL